MKGYRNYRISLEHVTDAQIESFEYAECNTEKEARRLIAKMSKSKKAEKLKTTRNQYGELPNVVRCYAISDENSNDEWVNGVHVLMYEDGKCTYSSCG